MSQRQRADVPARSRAEHVLERQALRARLTHEGRAHVRRFSWARAARVTHEVYARC